MLLVEVAVVVAVFDAVPPPSIDFRPTMVEEVVVVGVPAWSVGGCWLLVVVVCSSMVGSILVVVSDWLCRVFVFCCCVVGRRRSRMKVGSVIGNSH